MGRRRTAVLGLAALGWLTLAVDAAQALDAPPPTTTPPAFPAVDDGPCPAGLVDPVAAWPGAWFEDGRWWVPPLVAVAEAPVEDACARPLPQPNPHPAATPTTVIGEPATGERPTTTQPASPEPPRLPATR